MRGTWGKISVALKAGLIGVLVLWLVAFITRNWGHDAEVEWVIFPASGTNVARVILVSVLVGAVVGAVLSQLVSRRFKR